MLFVKESGRVGETVSLSQRKTHHLGIFHILFCESTTNQHFYSEGEFSVILRDPWDHGLLATRPPRKSLKGLYVVVIFFPILFYIP